MKAFNQLFIRACKVENSHQRLKSLRRRFYLDKNDGDFAFQSWICAIGFEVIKQTIGFEYDRFRQMANNSPAIDMRMNPSKYEGWSYERRKAYVDSQAVINYLRFLPKEDLRKIGYISPAKFRTNEKGKWRLTTRYEYVGY